VIPFQRGRAHPPQSRSSDPATSFKDRETIVQRAAANIDGCCAGGLPGAGRSTASCTEQTASITRPYDSVSTGWPHHFFATRAFTVFRRRVPARQSMIHGRQRPGWIRAMTDDAVAQSHPGERGRPGVARTTVLSRIGAGSISSAAARGVPRRWPRRQANFAPGTPARTLALCNCLPPNPLRGWARTFGYTQAIAAAAPPSQSDLVTTGLRGCAHWVKGLTESVTRPSPGPRTVP